MYKMMQEKQRHRGTKWRRKGENFYHEGHERHEEIFESRKGAKALRDEEEKDF